MRLIGLVNTVIVARILTPDDFGVVAVALTIVWLVEGVSDIRIHNVLISEKDPDDAFYNTTWTMTAARGLLVSVILLLSADLVAMFMDDDRLSNVIRVLALSTLLLGFVNPKFIQFEKNLDVSRIFILRLAEKITGVVVSITLAYIYRSYWAIVVGLIAGYGVHVLISYLFLPYRPRLTLERFDKVWHFTGWLTGESIVNTIARRLDNLFVGNALGVSVAGYAYMGDQLTRLPTTEFMQPMRRVLFAGLAHFGDDLSKLRQNALESIAVISGVALPMAVGFSLVADSFVLLLLGDKWAEVIPFVRFTILALGFMEVFSIAPIIALVLKDTRFIFYRSLVYSFIRLPILLIGIYAYGFIGFIIARVITDTILVLINVGMLRKMLDVPYFYPLMMIWRTIVSVMIMAAAVLAWKHMGIPFDTTFLGLILNLAIEASIGVVVYSGVHYATWIMASKPKGLETRMLEFVSSSLRR